MNSEFLVPLLAAAVQSGTPILYATLGEILTERSGILNLGVEGIMLVGALAAFLAARFTGSPMAGFLVGGICGAMLAGVHGMVCLGFRGNQVVSGLALTILGTGLANYLGTPFVGKASPGFDSVALPLLSRIPLLGPVLFHHDLLVYISYLVPGLLWLYLRYTRWGLALRAVGEYPEAAQASGLRVVGYRWFGVLIGGGLMGLGGGISIPGVHSSVDQRSDRRARLDCGGPGNICFLETLAGHAGSLSFRWCDGVSVPVAGDGYPLAVFTAFDVAVCSDRSRIGFIVMERPRRRSSCSPGYQYGASGLKGTEVVCGHRSAHH